jgi:hypothetical protein
MREWLLMLVPLALVFYFVFFPDHFDTVLNRRASGALRTGLSLELLRDIDTAAMESLKALDPNRLIRDVDIH